MAKAVQSSKKSVDLGAAAPRASRIRRDPPPPVKTVTAADIRDRETRGIVIGVVTMALVLFFVMIKLSDAAGWSPSKYTIYID